MTSPVTRVLCCLTTVTIFACGSAQAAQRMRTQHEAVHHAGAEAVHDAVAVLMPVGGSGVHGTIHFVQQGSQLKITGKVVGLKPGKHGFHVHQYGDLTDLEKGESAGSHYNPTGTAHGRMTDMQRHVGDFGNLVADEQGEAVVDLTDAVASLEGPHSILGRSLVVHAGEDQFTQPVGNAGARVAVGVIGVAAAPAAKAAQ